MKTMEPLTEKPYSEMTPKNQRASQLRFQTSELPPSDNIWMAKSTNNMVYYKYFKASRDSDNIKWKVESLVIENYYFTADSGNPGSVERVIGQKTGIHGE